MAVSVKKVRPSAPNVSASLTMLGGGVPAPAPAAQSSMQCSLPAGQAHGDQDSPLTKDTQIIFRTTESAKNSLKGFFASHGISLSKGVQLACFYLVQQIQKGDVEITDAGIISRN